MAPCLYGKWAIVENPWQSGARGSPLLTIRRGEVVRLFHITFSTDKLCLQDMDLV